GWVDGLPIRAGADGWDGDRCEPVLAGEPQGVLIAAAQQLRLAAPAAAPDGPHGVDHVARGEPVGAGDPRLPRRATTDPAARLQELGARGAVNRAIHTPAAQPRGAGGVDDRVRRLLGAV